MEEKQELTLGQQRVGVNFNPSQKEEVVKVKETCAFLIDYLQGYKNSISVLPENQILNPKEFNEKYAETFRAIATDILLGFRNAEFLHNVENILCPGLSVIHTCWNDFLNLLCLHFRFFTI